MRCKKCDYALWNIRARECPECGSPFRPSEFTFVPDSVRFTCPHCAQAYYGTSAEGHLQPAEFACVSCSRRISMDEMVLLPAEGVGEAQTEGLRVPWTERGGSPIVRWGKTVGMVLGMPRRTARALPEETSSQRALWFAVLTLLVYSMLGFAVFLLPFTLAFVAGAGFGGGRGIGPLFYLGVAAVLVLGAVLVGVSLWAAVTHLILRLSGPTAGGYGRTLTSVSYGSAANILLAIPCVGFYIGWLAWIWWAICAAIMVQETQKVSARRAYAAAFIPPGVVTLALVGLIAWLIIGTAGTASTAMGNWAAMQTQTHTAQAQQLLVALQDYADARGVLPSHAAGLAPDAGLGAEAFFFSFPSGRATNWIPQLTRLPADQQALFVTELAAAIPPDAAAHRLGDYVFTYHGIDARRGRAVDPGLWLFVGLNTSGPSFGPGAKPAEVYIALADGTVTPATREELPELLEAQNALRAEHGLPPLPDPTDVPEYAP